MQMLDMAIASHLDCVKLPDDFPVQFTSDIYRVGSLRILEKLLENHTQDIFRVHPKFYMFTRNDVFRCAYSQELPSYPDDYLLQCREIGQGIYAEGRLEVNEERIWAGDQLSFHYELALEQCQPGMKILDVACGDGYGTRMLARRVNEVHGADLDPEAVSQARELTDLPNVEFHVEDITQMTFGSNEFDAVCSMETIEHVDDASCLREIRRVLKPGGILILSTPQNRMGHIPVNAAHLHEYSLDEIMKLCREYFTVKDIIGIKAGRIVVPGDPCGTNTVIVCVKDPDRC
jgi:SAM-dependent methyltransferase